MFIESTQWSLTEGMRTTSRHEKSHFYRYVRLNSDSLTSPSYSLVFV